MNVADTEYPDEIHLIPCDDLREHEPSGDCWCRPQCRHDHSEGFLLFEWLHQSADGRERYLGGKVTYQ